MVENEKTHGLSDSRVLDYKNQDPFFIDYYKYRNACVIAKSKVLRDIRKDIILALSEFMDYTVNYITEYNDKMEELTDLLENYESLKLKEFRERINVLWKEISSDHVLFEILPKPNYNNEQNEIEKHWKDEKNMGLKQIRKAQVDIFKCNL